MSETAADPRLGEELVRIALGAAVHRPVLVWAYFGPVAWLEEARSRSDAPAPLLLRAERLRRDAEEAGDGYIAAEANALVMHLEDLLGARVSFQDQARRLLGIDDPRPSSDQVDGLRSEVVELAIQIMGGEEPVRRWEHERGLVGEAKWDAAMDAYVDGRRWLTREFPLAITEDLELGRDSEYHSSVHMNWPGKSAMRLSVNVGTPRTRETTRFEVAHNAYPGDYLRIASLHQYTYTKDGYIPACIKLKNAPESVISEGIEDTAYLRLTATPTPEDVLAAKLEWLRRGVAATAAIMVRDEQSPATVVADYCARQGFMNEARIAGELRLIEHPVWGVYRATYWPGRELILEADRRAERLGRTRDYLGFLYTGAHTPARLLSELDRFLAATPVG
jgi:hypothetical protein